MIRMIGVSAMFMFPYLHDACVQMLQYVDCWNSTGSLEMFILSFKGCLKIF